MNAVSNRKLAVEMLTKGHELRVVGSEKIGFRLCVLVLGKRTDPELVRVVMFGQNYPRQIDAVNYGFNRFGVTARKVTKLPFELSDLGAVKSKLHVTKNTLAAVA